MPEIVPDNDEQITIPKRPVDVSRWAGRDKHRPPMPKVQPDDSALRPEGIKPPAVNRVVGTDKVKKVKYKRANTANTREPSYLKQPSPPPPVAKEATNLHKLKELVKSQMDNPDYVPLEKLSLPTLASFGLGWYLSDTLTRDEKRRKERELENEWQRALDRQKDAETKKRPLKKSAMDKLNEYWKNNENVVVSDR